MAARAVRHEIELVGVERIGRRQNRRLAGIGDRRRRQAGRDIGVVRVFQPKVGGGQPPVEPAFAARDRIDRGRIGLQQHAPLQPVDEDRGDAAALVRHAGFLFNDGCERRQRFRRRRGMILRQAGHRLGDHGVHGLPHARDHVGPRVVPGVVIGLRQESAFRDVRRHRAGHALGRLHDGQRLSGRGAFGDGELADHGRAFGQQRQQLARTCMGRRHVFACAYAAGPILDPREHFQSQRVLDQPFPLQPFGDRRHALAARDQHAPFARGRPRRVEGLEQGEGGISGDAGRQHDNDEQRAPHGAVRRPGRAPTRSSRRSRTSWKAPGESSAGGRPSARGRGPTDCRD